MSSKKGNEIVSADAATSANAATDPGASRPSTVASLDTRTVVCVRLAFWPWSTNVVVVASSVRTASAKGGSRGSASESLLSADIQGQRATRTDILADRGSLRNVGPSSNVLSIALSYMAR